MYGALLEIFC